MRPAFALAAALALRLVAATPAFAAEDGGSCTVRVEHDKPVLSQACQDELDKAPDDAARADLLFRLAYTLNDNDRAAAALALLDRAVELDPENATYRHERGYTRSDLGFYREAIDDLDKAIELKPEGAENYNERSFSRESIGDFEGALADLDKAVELGGETPGLLGARVRNLVWLGRLDEAETDLAKLDGNADLADDVAREREEIARIRAYKPTGDPAAQCDAKLDAVDRAAASRVFDACTRAFLDARDNKKKAEFLTDRANVRFVMEQGYDRAAQDYKIAAGLDPDNAGWHSNYGFALLSVHHSWAARNEFDSALKLAAPDDRIRPYALAGRARAEYVLQDPDAAFADAKASFEAEPNEAALDILGDLAFDKGDKDMAKSFWMGAYEMGGRDDDLLKRLGSVGVTDPAHEPEPND